MMGLSIRLIVQTLVSAKPLYVNGFSIFNIQYSIGITYAPKTQRKSVIHRFCCDTDHSDRRDDIRQRMWPCPECFKITLIHSVMFQQDLYLPPDI